MKFKFTLILLFAIATTFAQNNSFPLSGNVGIGSLGTLSNINNRGLQVATGGHSSIILGDPINDGKGAIIQTSDDRHRLFLGANLYDDEIGSWKNFQTGKGGAGISIIADEGNWGSSIEFYIRKQDGFGNDFAKMTIDADGNVGIGTRTPQEKLAVNGIIRAKEIKVEGSNWPDYVFGQDYKILGLQELDAYIKANKHLPEMPSAKEVEANGMALGEMVKLQQKKIEELTLHLIEKDKQLAKEAEVNMLQENTISAMQKEFLQLKQVILKAKKEK